MIWRRVQLILAATLFVGWVSWLGVQAANRPRDPVISRAQLLNAKLIAIVDLAGDEMPTANGPLREVFGPSAQTETWKGRTVVLDYGNKLDGYIGPGTYIVPLVPVADDKAVVAGVPASPGYAGGSPRVYPLTPGTRRQLETR